MRAQGTPVETKCPYCGYERISFSIKGETQCSKCGKYFVFDKERQREYGRNWAKNNPEKYKQRYQRHNKRFPEIYSQLRDEFFNRKCSLCTTSNGRLEFHEIHGKKHPLNPVYIRDHIKDFTLLCKQCHEATHWAKEKLGFNFDEFKKLVIPFI